MTPDRHTLLDLAFTAAYAALLAGLLVFVWRRRHARRRGAGPALAAAVVWAALGAAEVTLRLAGVPRAVGRALLGAPLDPRYGWRGDFIEGDPASPRPRALVVGDSFTDAAGVPPGERFHAALGRELGFETWAYSAPGWGTLQEALLIDDVIDRVRPDLIVLQVCSNDFLNNDWELEFGSYRNNNLSVRPYWEDGRVAWRAPGRFVRARRFLAERSALAVWLNARVRRLGLLLEQRHWVSGSEQSIVREGRAWPPFARAVRTTEALVARIATRGGGRSLLLLPVDAYPRYAVEWRALAARQGLPLLTDAVERVEAAERGGARVRQPDGAHWSAEGHAVVGQALVSWVRQAPGLDSLRARLTPPPAAR